MRGATAALLVAAFLSVARAVPVALAETPDQLVAERHVLIRQRVEPEGPVLVGQPIRLHVEVLTRTWFPRAPSYPTTIEVPRAIVLPPESFATNFSERIGFETYAGQARIFTIFPQTAGRFEAPPIEVEVIVALEDASPSVPVPLRTEAVALEARFPDDARAAGPVLATPALEIREEYDRAFEGLRVGESFRRRVTRSIEGAPAMLLPPLEFEAVEGIAVYPDRPEVEDLRGRGQLSGTRVERAIYLLEKEGTFELPAIEVSWWNLRSSRLEREFLPAVKLVVAPNPDLADVHLGVEEEEGEAITPAEVREEEPGFDWRRAVAVAGVVVLVAFLGYRLRLRRGAMGARHEDAEPVLFGRLRRAASSGDPSDTYIALVRWLDRIGDDDRVATVRDLLTYADDPELARGTNAMERMLFGPRGVERVEWSGPAFARALVRVRRRLLQEESRRESKRHGLPSLNPGT